MLLFPALQSFQFCDWIWCGSSSGLKDAAGNILEFRSHRGVEGHEDGSEL